MLASLLAQAAEIPDFVRPTIDWHALAPEIILAITVVLTLLVDVVTKKKYVAAIIGVLGMFAAAIPLLTLAFCDSLDFCPIRGIQHWDHDFLQRLPYFDFFSLAQRKDERRNGLGLSHLMLQFLVDAGFIGIREIGQVYALVSFQPGPPHKIPV